MTSVELYMSDSDSESNQMELLEVARRRRQIRDSSNPFDMEEKMFHKNFRLSKAAFQDLFSEIQPLMKKGVRKTSIPDVLKLATALRFCAHGSYQISVGNEYCLGLAQSTVSLVLKEVFQVLETNICPKWIQFNQTESEMRRAKMHFFERSQIPGVIGCIDGTHVRIASPGKELQHLYYNRKGFYSINAMIVCDEKMAIRYIDARYPGSAHDSHVFNMSTLKTILEEKYHRGERQTWLLGDAGYALKPYLMTPYRDPEAGSPQATYNTKHARARNIVERTIGVLNNRFRCLLGARQLHYSPRKAAQITNVCAALHNICMKYNIPHEEEEMYEGTNGPNSDDVQHEDFSERDEAVQIRNNILFSLTSA